MPVLTGIESAVRSSKYHFSKGMFCIPFSGADCLSKELGKVKMACEVERMFVKFRMLRKRALRHTLEKLSAVSKQRRGDREDL